MHCLHLPYPKLDVGSENRPHTEDRLPQKFIIPSQNPIENVNSKVPDLESKQRFSEENPRIRSGQLSEHLKCPKTIEFRPILFLKLSSVKLQNQFRWFGHVQKISKPA